MDLVSVVIVLVILGVVLYLLSTIPMDPAIAVVIRVVIIIVMCLWLLKVFGGAAGLKLPGL